MNDEPIQSPPAEVLYADEVALLASLPGDRPDGWKMTPQAVVTFICGSDGEKVGKKKKGAPAPRAIEAKFIGDRRLVERCVVTLAGPRSLLLVGEPGTAKSMLSELLTAAISGTSERTVQGSAGTDEAQLRYGWNYAMLIGQGPSPEALVPSPILRCMQDGSVARIEEVTRCLSEVQDGLVSLLSERRLTIAELGETIYARPGFNVIATANTRDRGVSEMSAALKRRFNFEMVAPIAEYDDELDLVRRRTIATPGLVGSDGALASADEAVLKALVTLFRDLRYGTTKEGWAVEKPTAVMSAAEAVQVAEGVLRTTRFFEAAAAETLVGMLLGVVVKDVEDDRGRLLAYWDGVISRRAEDQPESLWRALHDHRARLIS